MKRIVLSRVVVFVSILFLGFAYFAPQGSALADEACVQQVPGKADDPINRIWVKVVSSGAPVFVQWTGVSGWFFDNGAVIQVEATYPNAYLTVTGSIDGVGCGSVSYTVQEWVSQGKGKGSSSQQVSVSSAPECSSLVAIHVIPLDEPNGLAVRFEVEGQLGERPFTILFGDDSSTAPLRDGGFTIWERHSYDQHILDNGVTIRANLTDSGQTCWSVKVNSQKRAVSSFRGEKHT
jgi:hypothetical protein